MFWHIFWHSIWQIFWHSIWHIFWHIFWHILWHSIWHIFWHIYLAFYLAYLLAFYLANLLAFYLTFYLAYLLTFFLTFFLAFYLAYLLTFYLTSFLTFFPLRSGSAHCDLEVAVEVRQCPLRSGSRGWGPAVPTGIWSSQLRSGSAHWDLELAVEVRQCPLRPGSRGWGPAVPTAIKNGKLSAELTAGYQCVLRFFQSTCLKYCACHEKVRLGHQQTWRSEAPKWNPLSGNQRPDLLTALMKMYLVLGLSRKMHQYRSSSNVPRLPSFLDMLQNPHVLLMPRGTTSERPKVVRTPGVFNILTSKCASRHNGVQFFISHLARWLRTRRFSEPTFRPSGATNHWKNTMFRDFPTFSRIWIFFLLTLSLLWSSLFYSSLLSDSSHLCFSSVHIVGSLASKLPSVTVFLVITTITSIITIIIVYYCYYRGGTIMVTWYFRLKKHCVVLNFGSITWLSVHSRHGPSEIGLKLKDIALWRHQIWWKAIPFWSILFDDFHLKASI